MGRRKVVSMNHLTTPTPTHTPLPNTLVPTILFNNLDTGCSNGPYDGRIYDGDFRDNKMHGKGVYKWPNKGDYRCPLFVSNPTLIFTPTCMSGCDITKPICPPV